MQVRMVSKMRNITKAKMPNLGAAIWRTVLNITLILHGVCVPELLLSHCLLYTSDAADE